MSKTVTNIIIVWKQKDGVTGTATYSAGRLGPTAARQRAASRTALLHEQGLEYMATEYYEDGSKHEFKNF